MRVNLRVAGIVLLLIALALYGLGYSAWIGFLFFGAIAEIAAWFLILTKMRRGDPTTEA
ncbi:MAG: hypothetical protein AAF525_15680 [Pseudomonadota bacterium]